MNLKRILLFLGIFIFMFIPKNVFAESLVPGWATIDGITFVANGEPLDSTVDKWLGQGFSQYFDISIDVMYENDEERSDYPYVLVYFKSFDKNLSIVRNSSCTTTCFSSAIQYGIIGLSKWQNWDIYLYAMILPINKLYYDQNRAMYRVNDILRFSTDNTSASIVQFTNIWFTKDNSILNYSYLGSEIEDHTQDIINNQNSNTQSIINNQNSNTQSIINNQDSNQSDTNQKLDNLDNTMKSEESPSNSDVSNKNSQWSSKNASTGPISGMVLMPITLLNAYTTGMNTTCSPYNLGNLMGTDLILPCINVSNYVGSTLWGVIDILFSGFMIYAMGKKMVKIFNDFTNLRDNQVDELYGGGK